MIRRSANICVICGSAAVCECLLVSSGVSVIRGTAGVCMIRGSAGGSAGVCVIHGSYLGQRVGTGSGESDFILTVSDSHLASPGLCVFVSGMGRGIV